MTGRAPGNRSSPFGFEAEQPKPKITVNTIAAISLFARTTEEPFSVSDIDNPFCCRVDLATLRTNSFPSNKPRCGDSAKNGRQCFAAAPTLEPATGKLKRPMLTHVSPLPVKRTF